MGKMGPEGASSKAVVEHPDLLSPNGSHGPLTYEVELYQVASVSREDVNSVSSLRRDFLFGGKKTMLSGKLMQAVESGAVNIRIGGATDIYTYRAEGVEDMEYPIPDPEPISRYCKEQEAMKICKFCMLIMPILR